MKTPAPADLHRWSEELARNPASLAFLPLARAYRRLSRRDLALQLCLRGLEHHPTHVEAHALLALLYFEAGERAKAADEWATVLRLKPGNFEALRGMGFRYLEQADLSKSRQHLERAALIRPDDTTVQEALRLIRHREASSPPGRPPLARPAGESFRAAPPAASGARPAQAPSPTQASGPPAPRSSPAASSRSSRAVPPVGRAEPLFQPGWDPVQPSRPSPAVPQRSSMAPAPPPDPSRVFDALLKSAPVLGVLLFDRRGLVLAGALNTNEGSADEISANLGGAIEEAIRAVTHLDLGGWRGLMLECSGAILHVRPVGEEAMVVLAARRNSPAGWIVRAAEHAASVAGQFVEVYS